MEYNYLVTVIMPTYKQDILLHKAVESILAQTYQNIELIVIDDNFDDVYKKNNADYFENLSHAHGVINYIINEENIGSAKSRNKGINLARGAYITFLDDDDYYMPSKIENQLKSMVENNADYSICNLALVNENGKVIDKRERKYLYKNEELIIKHLKYHLTGTDSLMFKSAFLREIDGFDEIDLGDEFYLMIKAISKSEKFIHVNQLDVAALIHSTNGLSSCNNKIICENNLIKNILEKFPDLSRKTKRYLFMRHHFVKGYAYIKGRRIFKGLFELFRAFIRSPIGFVQILTGKDR